MEPVKCINWLSPNRKNKIFCLLKAKGCASLAFYLIPLFYFGQVNLVPNPGFEVYDTCPQYPNSISYAVPWNTLKAGGGCGPEFFHECANPSNAVGVPYNCGGSSFQYPRNGKGYSLMTWFTPTSVGGGRKYVQSSLTTTLQAGKSYCVTYYLNLANRSKYTIDEYGAYFDDGTISSLPCKPVSVASQIKSPIGFFVKDTLGWYKVQGSFVAVGNESYITLGSFIPQASTNYTVFNNSISSSVADYYVDDVSVIELNLAAYAGPDKSILNGDSVFIGRPPETGLGCVWYNGTVTVGTGAGIWVKPSVTTTYVVQQDICGLIKTDTMTVNVGYAGIKEHEKGIVNSKLYPNPNNGEFVIELDKNLRDTQTNITIMDVTGKVVFNKTMTGNVINLKSELTNGIYLVKVKQQDGSTDVHKLVINK